MKLLAGVILGFVFSAAAGFSQPPEEARAGVGQPPAAYDRTVAPVVVRNATPAQIEGALDLIARTWGIFSSLQYLHLPILGTEEGMLFLRGRGDEVEEALRVAEYLDRLYPPAEGPPVLVPLPLLHLSGSSMREKLLNLSDRISLGIEPDQLVIYPSGAGGSLFFYGSPPEAKQVREIKEELDRPRYESFADMASAFLRTFREDFVAHFLTVSTYAASAVLLLILHFILSNLPWLGRHYQRWFTLIWTRLIDDVKGRDFVFEVIKSLTETAVEAAEQASRSAMKGGVAPSRITPEEKKSRALSIARDLLVYRGFDPNDPQIRLVVNDMIESRLFSLRGKENTPGS
ncbi:MAG: hypothetical protein V1789_04965 [PVC group bacterium]